MKRRRLPPDTRLDWRDPNMPVLRNYLMANGETKTQIDADYEHRYRAHSVATSNYPSWRDDPTYNSKRKFNPNG